MGPDRAGDRISVLHLPFLEANYTYDLGAVTGQHDAGYVFRDVVSCIAYLPE